MTDVELAIRMTADATDAANAMDDVGAASQRMAADVDDAGRKADQAAARLDGVADSSDAVASKGAQAAGALGGLGDLVGGKFGTAMVAGGVAMQGFADAGDLVNVVTESAIVKKAKDIVVTTAQRVAHLASAAATRTVAAAQWAWNAAMSANPIGLVIAAVVALVAGFILLYKRSERFRAIVQAVMAASRKAIDAVWKVLQRVGHFIGVVLVTYWRVYSTAAKVAWNVVRTVVTTVIGKVVSIVQGARARLVAVWDAVKAAAVRVWNALRDTVVSVVTRIVEKAADVREKFGNAFQGILDKGREVFAALLAPIQKVIDLVEKVVDAISNIKLPDIDLPNIPGLRAIAVPVAGRAAPAGGGDTVNIHLPLLAALDQRMIALLITALENYYRRRGQRVQLVAS